MEALVQGGIVKVSREAAKLAGRLAMLVTISRTRGEDLKGGVMNYFMALENSAIDAAARDVSIRPMVDDLITQLREALKDKPKVIMQ